MTGWSQKYKMEMFMAALAFRVVETYQTNKTESTQLQELMHEVHKIIYFCNLWNLSNFQYVLIEVHV